MEIRKMKITNGNGKGIKRICKHGYRRKAKTTRHEEKKTMEHRDT